MLLNDQNVPVWNMSATGYKENIDTFEPYS